ncbi:MAG TPA: protein translocase subunit SecF [Clostridia bacterium]|nr:protein translocase subunit SecF [Clostridia bacterium]
MSNFDFVGKRRIWFGLSSAVIITGLIFMVLPGHGLRLGIDFTGGSLLDLTFQKSPTTSEVREVLSQHGFGGSMIQKGGALGRDVLIRTKTLTDQQREAVLKDLSDKVGPYTVNRIEEVRGVISEEITRSALLALLIANVGILAYVTLRFEFKFAVAAIVALVHDVLVTLGFTAITGMELQSPFVAAILTIVGYSINDTIVVFDRIRENMKTKDAAKSKKKPEGYGALANRSISETLTRSINTSLTTILAIAAVYLFGGKTTKDFALTLIVGITAGTYSSIFIASPLWVWWKEHEILREKAVKVKA